VPSPATRRDLDLHNIDLCKNYNNNNNNNQQKTTGDGQLCCGISA